MPHEHVRIPVNSHALEGDLWLEAGDQGVILFAHGSGSSRLSPRNRYVADYLRSTGRFGTLLFDLLTPEEDADYQNRFDIDLLAQRLHIATGWLEGRFPDAPIAVGYFGASTGAAAALVAASERDDIFAVVSRGGRPDLAGPALGRVDVPTLLVVGGADLQVIGLNEQAMRSMPGEVEIEIVPGATHLFEEPGALDDVARLALGWFEQHIDA